MSLWIEFDSQRVQVLRDGAVLWEHDTRQPYPVRRHMVSPKKGAVWSVVSRDPLTLRPSLHCDPSLGGCGLHGFVTNGRWA